MIINRPNVHYTHSRKDMVGFIKIYDIPLTDYEDLGRSDLGIRLYDKLKSGAINSDIDELIQYLTMSMPRKAPVCAIKKIIFDKIIQLKRYHYFNFKIKQTDYKSIKDIEADMDFITQYGDLPSVRYITNKINNDNKIKVKYEVEFSRQVRTKVQDVNKLNVMKGKYLIKFD